MLWASASARAFACGAFPRRKPRPTWPGNWAFPWSNLMRSMAIDVDVDGADEVDPQCNLIKGYGGALVREKIVAAASRKLVILVGPEKIVSMLGSRGKLPVEVVPFAVPLARRRLPALGCDPVVRIDPHTARPFLTDNGNCILDCHIAPLVEPGGVGTEDPGYPRRAGHGIVSRHGRRGAHSA